MSAAFAFAYVAGVLAAFNPCGFAMLPGWVGYFLATGERREGDLLARIVGALGVGALMSAGFIAVFAVAALATWTGAAILNRILPVVDVFLAIALAAVAGFFLAGAKLPGLSLPLPRMVPGRNFRGMFIYGLGYGIATLSCVLPVFLVALGVAASGRRFEQIAGFAGFSLGVGTVIMLVALIASLAKDLAERLRWASRYVPFLSGLLLLGAAAYIAWREIPLAALSLGLALPDPLATMILTGLSLAVGVAVGMMVALRQARSRKASVPSSI